MTDTFASFSDDALAFLDALSRNNNRDWFTAQKTRFESEVKAPALHLLDAIAAPLGRLSGAAVTPKLFRIHRDLRFSRDKTPYNTHLHLYWSRPDRPVGWLFGISAEYLCAGVGIMARPSLVPRWREATAGPGGAALMATLATLTAQGHRIDPPELKRVPPPYGNDHPQGDLLRRKSLVVWTDFHRADLADPVAALTGTFTTLDPFRRQLDDLLA